MTAAEPRAWQGVRRVLGLAPSVGAVAAGIQHQPGPVLLACGGCDHESLILLLPGGRLALLPANSGGGAAVQPMGLQGRFVEEAVGAAVLQKPVIS